MGLEDDILQNPDQPADANQEVPKKLKVTYARDFLLSLSELDLCKQLPSGFDKSILNEFHDAFHGSQEKTRTSGGFAAQNFKRTEYSASPPTRRDANSYSRGSTGKWESRSRDGDSQTDRDSESGRQIGTHPRRPWQNSEHDGLLGSGSSPNLTGYTSGTSAPKFRANDQYHLNRSNAPYQPPRPYKAVPHGRTTTNDLHNDETFGSADITSEDQAEEERKRRAEFELMRKERYNSGQEKQHSSSVDSKDDLIFNATDYEGNINDGKKILIEGNESHESSKILAQHNGSIKPSTIMQSPAPRPVVPPGFVPPGFGNTNTVAKSTIKLDTKVRISDIDNKLVHGTVNLSTERDPANKTAKQPDGPSHLNKSNHSGSVELLIMGGGLESKIGEVQNTAAAASQEFVTSSLKDIFANSLNKNNSGLSISNERPNDNFHDNWKGSTMEASKFAHWFVEDDGKRPDNCQLSEKLVDLFPLIGGGPTSVLNSRDGNAAKNNDTSGPFLTCEDLEQSILSELSHHKVPSESLQQGSVSHDTNIAQTKAGIDALASHHLLSVLHKGPAPKDVAPPLNIDKGSSDRLHLFESTSMGISTDGFKQGKVDKTSDIGKNPTLEALFGKAFMKELQAVDAPVSSKRDSFSSDSSRLRLPEDQSLINASDPLNPSNSFLGHVEASKNAGYASSHLPIGSTDRLGALSAMFRDGRSGQDNPAFPYNPDRMPHNNAYHNIHAHSSLPQFPPHTSQGRPMFNQLDAHHTLPPMRFPDNMIRRDQPPTHQFSPSRQMLHQPRPMGFDLSSQQPMMQQVHLQSNAPPSHLLRQYSGNLPQPSHPDSQVLGFRQELDPMQRLLVGHQQPGYGRSPPVSDIGSGNHHPDVLQRLMEMELKSKAKPNHPFAGHFGGLPNF
ncbi:unnamed protein product [Rhodiola kirilowii]